MEEDVGVEPAHEGQGGGGAVRDADPSRPARPPEVVLEHGEHAPRGAGGAAQSLADPPRLRDLLRGVREEPARDVLAHLALDEGDGGLGQPSQHGDGIGGGVGRAQEVEGEGVGEGGGGHGRREQLPLARRVPQQGGRAHPHAPRDLGEGRAVVALLGEGLARGAQHLLAADPGPASHRKVNI